jgi:hypothetical protein
MLFLRRLRTIEFKRDRHQIRVFQRVDDGNSLLLSNGVPNDDRVWHVLRGDFSADANKLRELHGTRIEAKRSSGVTLAIPADSLRSGVLCAFLPTEHDVGLPFHVNADFFTTNDRKRVIFANDYQSEWNREAIRAAATAVSGAIETLPSLLGAQRFWGLVLSLKEVADRAAKDIGESTLARFWEAVEPHLRKAPVIYTTKGHWTTSDDASLLLQREESSAIPVLEGLGVSVVHEDLRPYQTLLRAEVVGVPLFNIEKLCAALKCHGLSRRVVLSALPSCLRPLSGRKALWREAGLFLERQQRTPNAKAEDERRLREVAIAPGRDGTFWPCGEIYSADNATVTLFESLQLGTPFVASDEAFRPLLGLCRPLDAAAAIDLLRNVDGEQFRQAWDQDQLPLKRLFEWFENRRQEVFASEVLRKKLAELPLYPSLENLCELDKLALPGNFEDPLGLAELVDLAALGGRRQFLNDLGMPELDFRVYAVKLLPTALKHPIVSPSKRRAAIVLLADHLGEMSDNHEALQALAMTPLVECTDGEFRHARDCHFDSGAVQDCLGSSAHFVVLPKKHEVAVRRLYAWLGVASEPRVVDIVTKVVQLSRQPYSSAATQQIQRIIGYLGKSVKKGDDSSELRFFQAGRKWLPARGKADRWYAPNELYAVYQANLFESQALFLDLAQNIQNASSDFLEFLGIHLTPPVNLVVKHLIHCVTHQVAVNAVLYRFLNDKATDPAIAQLRDKKCLWLGDAYRAPSQVFWGDHPFGRYRWRLAEELRGFNNLLRQIGVREVPEYQDALSVLEEISADFSKTNNALSGEDHTVLMECWQALGKALDENAIPTAKLTALHSLKCVPNASRILNPPEWTFFDNRAGLAAKFDEFLINNVIPRPLGAGDAFAVAGVRPLASAVEIELLECIDPTDSPELVERIRERRNEIARVLESQVTSQQAVNALSRLDNIRCRTAASLLLRFPITCLQTRPI